MTIEIESPHWNIFESPMENNSTESYEYVEYCKTVTLRGFLPFDYVISTS